MLSNEEALLWLGIGSLAVFVISVLSLPWLVAMIPADYFCHDRRVPASWKQASPAWRWIFLILKNCVGFTLLAAGILMLFIPGQGVLTMAMGLVLMDYPGKYRLERALVSKPSILRGLNWLRAKRGVAPLRFD